MNDLPVGYTIIQILVILFVLFLSFFLSLKVTFYIMGFG